MDYIEWKNVFFQDHIESTTHFALHDGKQRILFGLRPNLIKAHTLQPILPESIQSFWPQYPLRIKICMTCLQHKYTSKERISKTFNNMLMSLWWTQTIICTCIKVLKSQPLTKENVRLDNNYITHLKLFGSWFF